MPGRNKRPYASLNNKCMELRKVGLCFGAEKKFPFLKFLVPCFQEKACYCCKGGWHGLVAAPGAHCYGLTHSAQLQYAAQWPPLPCFMKGPGVQSSHSMFSFPSPTPTRPTHPTHSPTRYTECTLCLVRRPCMLLAPPTPPAPPRTRLQVCNHPMLSYPPQSYAVGEAIVRTCGKLVTLDRMLIKLRAAGHRCAARAVLHHVPSHVHVQCTGREEGRKGGWVWVVAN